MAKQNNPQNQQVNLSQLTAEGLKWAELQDRVNSGISSYLEEIARLNDLTKSLNKIKEQEQKITAEINSLANATTQQEKDRLKLLKDRKAVLDYNYNAIKKEAKLLKEVLKDAEKVNMTLGAAGAALGKGIMNLPKNFMNIMGSLKELFEMDKAIRVASKDMGLLTKGSEAFRKSIEKVSFDKTIGIGVGIKELAELQAGYSELVGRNVMMNDKALESVAYMSKATQLGIEGAAQMAAEFDSQGLSAEKTASFVEDTLNNSSKMGLNATKVMKNISGNIKMLNRYRFKDGAKGLAKMAETVTKLGVDMNVVSGMADKLFDLEPAIEMSAQLQVMGGAWSDLADPFKLMYMARNDTNALTESVANAAKEAMSFAKDGSIETTAEAMHKLRIIAQQTNLEFDDLMEMGKKAFKMDQIKAKVFGVDEETKEFIANTAEFKDGKATITIDGQPKLLSMLTKADKDRLKELVKEKQTMKDRANAAQSFDEKITNLINMVKISMMPIVEELTKVLDPLVTDLMSPNSQFKQDLIDLGKNIGTFVKWAAKGLKFFVENVVDIFGAKGIFLTYLLGKSASWIANGLLLAQGFNMGTKGFSSMPGGKTMSGGFKGMRTGFNMMKSGRVGAGASTLFKGAGKAAFPLALAGVGLDAYQNLSDENLGTGEAIGKTLDQNKFMALGAGIGAMFGGVGAIPGAGIGALVDLLVNSTAGDKALVGNYIGKGYGVQDGLFGETKGRRAILQEGKITPIDYKDDLLAMKPKGVVDKALNSGGGTNYETTKIEFGDMNINGTIRVDIPGNNSIAIDLAKNTAFQSSITKIVNSQIEKNINGGKNRG